AQPRNEVGAERAAVEADGVAVLHEPAAARGAAGHAHADGHLRGIEPGLPRRLDDQPCGRVEDGLVTALARRGDPASREHLERRRAASTRHHRLDLGPSDVDADASVRHHGTNLPEPEPEPEPISGSRARARAGEEAACWKALAVPRSPRYR